MVYVCVYTVHASLYPWNKDLYYVYTYIMYLGNIDI